MRKALILLATLTVLHGCGSSQDDRPSPSVAGATKQQRDAVRPGYKVGRPYTIYGVRYHPRESFSYVEEGTASWYGPGFHSRRTANGEIYDQHAFTAAHKTLQLPAVVRVTNLENGRAVVVRVNDRGPFVGDRIIDLSERAAKALGFRNSGLARVRVAVVPDASRSVAQMARDRGSAGAMDTIVAALNEQPSTPRGTMVAAAPARSAPKPPANPAPAARSAAMASATPLPPTASAVVSRIPPRTESAAALGVNWFLQAGAFADPSNADRALRRLGAVGPTTVVSRPSGGRTLYLVRVGPYDDKIEAQDALRRVIEVGFDGALLLGSS
jgi:rare lipoprotein A